MTDWASDRLGLTFIPPGQPWRSGYIESFNNRVSDECLNINVIGDWEYQHDHHWPPLRTEPTAAGPLRPPITTQSS
jgi:Integrase core domain